MQERSPAMFREVSRRRALADAATYVVENVRHTRYSAVPVVDPSTGTYDLDSAGFLAYLLRSVAPEHYARILRDPRRSRLRGFDVFDYLVSLVYDATNGWRRTYDLDGATVYESSPGWKRVARLADVRRGDVLAWEVPTSRGGTDPGYVAIVAGRARPAGQGRLALRVFDASSTPHFDDSRIHEGSFGAGVGAGFIGFRLDASGAPVAVRFGPADSFRRLPIVVGRLAPIASGAARKATERAA